MFGNKVNYHITEISGFHVSDFPIICRTYRELLAKTKVMDENNEDYFVSEVKDITKKIRKKNKKG